jgi:regulatory protein
LNPLPADNAAADADAFQQASAAALRLLARREHSTRELQHKLTDRGHDAALVDEVLAVLREEGALSDCRFAETYAQSRFERGFGPLRIEAELRERGVSPGLIDDALATPAFDWERSACRQRQKRFGSGVPDDFAGRARQMRFLQQRGFNNEQIRAALAGEAETAV